MLLTIGRGLSPRTKTISSSAAVDLSTKTVALIGDSITGQNISANGREHLSQGYMTMLNAITGQRYVSSPSYNLGVSGYSLSQIEAGVTDLAALSPTPDLVIVLGGSNDTVAATTESAMITSLGNIYSYITGTLGAKVIALTIPPRTQHPGGEALTTDMQTKIDNVNAWILSQSGDVTPIDIYQGLVLSGTDTPDPAYFDKEGTSNTSYVHPNPQGALKIAQTIQSALAPIYGTYDIPDMSQDNLLANDTLAGAGGTNNSNLTGDVANNNTFYAYSSASGSLSKPTATSQRIDISYTDFTSYDTVQFYEGDITSGYSASDTVYAEAEIEILNGEGLEGLWIEVSDKGSSTLTYKCMTKFDVAEFPTDNRTYHIKTPIFQPQAGNTALAVKIRGELDSSGGQTASIDFIIQQIRCAIA